jgi:hypothetical protein
MKYAVEMGSGAKFHKHMQQLMWGGAIHRHTDSIEIALAYFRK